ncbi:hypothetical protein DSM02_2375 [Leeuwenhoekiella polynyae]|uniref:Apea-like HEPN domain-containing protein n=1 Tax=Leeuwenhoekiella polynyae TaxID=1550906 RepID=A0A4Q0P355_9FLAO|nr:hypothetical protein DSM02_2375 [Leeuwenhoekiella polynyae]
MSNLKKKINETFDYAVYLHMVGNFVPNTDLKQIKDIVTAVNDFLKNSDPELIKERLPEIRSLLKKMTDQFINKFPLKCTISEIATAWNDLFKNRDDEYSFLNSGIDYGWFEKFMDLSNFYHYNYVPYHYKIGIFGHKGLGGIEEEFLLKDSFNLLVKAQYFFDVLLKYGEILKQEEAKGQKFTNEKRSELTELNYEVAVNSRLSIVSFFSFIECFVNSIGHDYSLRNLEKLDEKQQEILNGMKNKGYLSLKSKIEIFQKIIRQDKRAIINTTDDNQIKEPFKSFFENFEDLRNSSVHYSPKKVRIWLKPQDWIKKANDFSKISMEVGLLFWKTCYPDFSEPDYIGRLDFNYLYDIAKKKSETIKKIEKQM